MAAGGPVIPNPLRRKITMQPIAVLDRPTSGPLFTAHNGDSDPDMDEALRRARAEVAEHLTAVNPGNLMTDSARYLTAVTVTGSVARVQPLLRELPALEQLPAGTTRADYAQHIAMSGGDLPPSPIHIPRIPQQPQRPNNTVAVAA